MVTQLGVRPRTVHFSLPFGFEYFGATEDRLSRLDPFFAFVLLAEFDLLLVLFLLPAFVD